jgi:hypothetical protein
VLTTVGYGRLFDQIETCTGAGSVNTRGKPAGLLRVREKKIIDSRGKNGSGSYRWRVPVGAGMTLREFPREKSELQKTAIIWTNRLGYSVVNSAIVLYNMPCNPVTFCCTRTQLVQMYWSDGCSTRPKSKSRDRLQPTPATELANWASVLSRAAQLGLHSVTT